MKILTKGILLAAISILSVSTCVSALAASPNNNSINSRTSSTDRFAIRSANANGVQNLDIPTAKKVVNNTHPRRRPPTSNPTPARTMPITTNNRLRRYHTIPVTRPVKTYPVSQAAKAK